MTIQLDHTIVPAKDKKASAEFFAEIFGLTVTPGHGYFTQVRVNEALTLDFADDPEIGGGFGHHYAFHVSDAEFDAIFGRIKEAGIPYDHVWHRQSFVMRRATWPKSQLRCQE